MPLPEEERGVDGRTGRPPRRRPLRGVAAGVPAGRGSGTRPHQALKGDRRFHHRGCPGKGTWRTCQSRPRTRSIVPGAARVDASRPNLEDRLHERQERRCARGGGLHERQERSRGRGGGLHERQEASCDRGGALHERQEASWRRTIVSMSPKEAIPPRRQAISPPRRRPRDGSPTVGSPSRASQKAFSAACCGRRLLVRLIHRSILPPVRTRAAWGRLGLGR